ncbi:ABC transporter ATP-binding protein [Trinickia sp. LjRoot230]|uniref:ABC transporter ATP-binding protein n=1 Tax=Trinickia sp. LjRoot230 TaxID=3342288 RepID=UPI003ED058C6
MICPPLLHIEALCAAHGKHDVLDDISLSLAAGSTACVLGPPGAGKTTLLMTVAGILRPKRGSIRFAGEEIRRKRANEIVARGIAFVPHNRLLFRNLSVRDNLLAGVWREPDRPRVEADASQLFERFPRLKSLAAQSAGKLSGGEQQLLAIARALMFRPTLLLIDEPTAGLPPDIAEDIVELIAQLNEQGLAVLIAAQHDSGRDAMRVAGHAYLLEQGRIAPGAPAHVHAQKVSTHRRSTAQP